MGRLVANSPVSEGIYGGSLHPPMKRSGLQGEMQQLFNSSAVGDARNGARS